MINIILLTEHPIDQIDFPLPLDPIHTRRCIILTTSTFQIITCSTYVKHPPTSDTTSHPSVSLNKITSHPSFQSISSISTSLMKKDGSSGLVNNLNQAPNNYYVSPKMTYVSKLGHLYFSMVSIASLVFKQESLLTSYILIYKYTDNQLLGSPRQ